MTTIRVKVKANARTSELELLTDGTWRASLRSPPVDGRANEELIRLVAEQFEVPKMRISIKRGISSRLKQVQIVD